MQEFKHACTGKVVAITDGVIRQFHRATVTTVSKEECGMSFIVGWPHMIGKSSTFPRKFVSL